MLKKIDRGALFLAKQQALFRCPKCHREMNQIEKSLICLNGHRFDLAKKGTLYFWITKSKRSMTTRCSRREDV